MYGQIIRRTKNNAEKKDGMKKYLLVTGVAGPYEIAVVNGTGGLPESVMSVGGTVTYGYYPCVLLILSIQIRDINMFRLIKDRQCVIIICLSVIIFAIFSSCRCGDNIQAAKKYFNKGRYDQAFESFKRLAEQGNPEAQYWLGVMFDSGKGIQTNQQEAITWFQKSYEGGYKYAPGILGCMYFTGTGLTQDYGKALFLLKQGAEMSDQLAEGWLGLMYKQGRGVSQDYSIAVTWLERSANQGFAPAQVNLAFCYEKGFGVEKDATKAFALYCKSAEQDDVIGQLYLARAYRYGVGTTPNKQRALEYYEKAAKQKYEPAIKELKEFMKSTCSTSSSPTTNAELMAE
jgi:TPR repeat protein